MKVFQIGFNKCATLSLHEFFKKNGHKSVHWDDGKWNSIFHSNHIKLKPLCDGHDDVIFWSDLTYLQRHFETFAIQYPDAKFIYNTRPLDDWIKSRHSHYSKLDKQKIWIDQFKLDQRKINLEQYWRSEVAIYEHRLFEYFSGIHSNRLLIFDIMKDKGSKISNFLPELKFNDLDFPYIHKTNHKK